MNKCLILFIICAFYLSSSAQSHTYQFGYGKQFLEFTAPSHNFFINYQKHYKSKVFWSIRSEFAVEEDPLWFYNENEAYTFQNGQEMFVYEGLVQTDPTDVGLIQLSAMDAFEHKFKLYPSIGYNFFKEERIFGLNATTGGGIFYEKIKGFYSQIGVFLDVTEEGYEQAQPTLLIEHHKRGFDFFLNFGFQMYFNLRNDFQIGFDATIETNDFGGFPITHNLFLAKKF